jgi:hypothetical protein
VTCSMWQVTGGRQHMLTDSMISVNKVVRTVSLFWPVEHDFTIPHGRNVDKCSLLFFGQCREFDLKQRRSATQFCL